jgi:hypothetical protein
LIASSASQRRTVDADTLTANPSATAWAARSAELHRDNATSRAAGGWHALVTKRLRHRLTTSISTSSRSATALFVIPAAADRTIFARITSANDAV